MNKDTLSLEQGVLLDLGSLDKHDLDLAPLLATLPHWRIHRHTAFEERLSRLRGAQVAVLNKVVVDADLLARLPELRLVCVTATGTDNIDLEAAARHGVTVCNARDYATESVVQHWQALLLAVLAALPAQGRALAAGRWSAAEHFCLLDHPPRQAAGLILGILGHGTLGRAVAERARALGMTVWIAERPGRSPRPGRRPWEAVLAGCDVLSLHCPLTEDTRGLLDAEALARMKPGALLINTARGALVDSQALAEALARGHLGGAALDVLEREPPPADHLLLRLDHPRLVITPHVAWASRQARQRLVQQTAENIQAYLHGHPRRVVVHGVRGEGMK